jgi:predicted NBD/HSP70 family sugar kinase
MSNGFGSVSHLVLDAQGPLCLHCGREGCFETLASGISIVNLAEKFDKLNKNKDQRLHFLISEADNGNEKIKKLFFNAGRSLAKGIDSVMTLLNPSTVIVAGEVGRQKDYSEGAISMLHELKYKNTENFLKFSNITSDEAAKSVALDEFVFSKLFDIEQLRVDSDKLI